MEALAAASSGCILRRKPGVSTACSTPAWPSLLHPLRPPGTGSAPAPPLYPQQPRALLRAASGGKGVWATSRPAPPLTRGSTGLERRTRFYFIHNSSLQKRDRKAGQGASSSRGGKRAFAPPREGPTVLWWGGEAAGREGRWRAAPPPPPSLRRQRPWRGAAEGGSGRGGLVGVVHVVHVALLVLRHLRGGRAPSGRGATAPSCASRPAPAAGRDPKPRRDASAGGRATPPPAPVRPSPHLPVNVVLKAVLGAGVAPDGQLQDGPWKQAGRAVGRGP